MSDPGPNGLSHIPNEFGRSDSERAHTPEVMPEVGPPNGPSGSDQKTLRKGVANPKQPLPMASGPDSISFSRAPLSWWAEWSESGKMWSNKLIQSWTATTINQQDLVGLYNKLQQLRFRCALLIGSNRGFAGRRCPSFDRECVWGTQTGWYSQGLLRIPHPSTNFCEGKQG